uniref:THUMP domain-containing protein n=1 Tax=Vannella robusta TaxID=1487602 RepID=A0A7S4HNQ7_9EUKA
MLSKQCCAMLQPYVETNFISGQILFCCSSLVSPVDIVARVQTVERICASICSFVDVPYESETGLDAILHVSYHWDDERFDRACHLWSKTIEIRRQYDPEGNKVLIEEDQEYDFRPTQKRCSCSRISPSPESATLFRINETITQRCNDSGATKTIQPCAMEVESTETEVHSTSDVPAPPPLVSFEQMNLNEQLPASCELLKQRAENYRNRTETDLSVQERAGVIPTFRVTSERSGPVKHGYSSLEISKYLGGSIFRRYEWPVNLEQYDIHIWGHMFHNKLLVGIQLTPDTSAIHRKSRIAFGTTTLKPSIAACIGIFAKIQPHEIVLDPMCGTCTIPTEIAARVPGCFAIGGDFCSEAIDQSKENTAFSQTLQAIKNRSYNTEQDEETLKTKLRTTHSVCVIQWNVINIPLRDDSIDVIVCDMPFGRRSGSYSKNAILYPKFMNEITRVLIPGGRIILLTLQKKLLIRVVAENPSISIKEMIPCFMGGLPLDLYYLEYNPETQ